MTIGKVPHDATATDSTAAIADNIRQLKSVFPEVVTEGRNGVSINVDVLKALVGDRTVVENEEKYGLTWHGKRQARQLALTPATGTLRPSPHESVNWDTTHNLMVEGDNLEVLKLLQKSYASKVKLIFIDPPYNTGRDFVYPDDYKDSIQNYLRLTGQVDGGRKITSNTETNGRFHSNWLNMMYPRLKLARNLLSDDGVIFITVDEGEVSNLMAILNELFGEENAVVAAAWHKRVSPANDTKWFSSDHDLVLIYAKNKELWHPRRLTRNEVQLSNYRNPDQDPRGPWNSATYTCNKSRSERPNLYYKITNPNTGKEVWPKETAVWKYSEDVTKGYLLDNRLYWGADGLASAPRIKLFLSEMGGVVPRSLWTADEYGHTQEATTELKELFHGSQVFDSPKPVKLLKRILEMGCSGNDDIVLDFFAGSGTTGHAVFEINVQRSSELRFILVQLPEPLHSAAPLKSIADITKERLRRAGEKVKNENPMFVGDLGFRVFKLDASNIQPWQPDPEDLPETIASSVEHLKQDRTEADILYEVLLKLGLDLCVRTDQRTIAGKTVYSVGGGVLFACLSSQITREEVDRLAEGIVGWHADLAPAGDTTCVFRDSAFADDVAKVNLAAILYQCGFHNLRSL